MAEWSTGDPADLDSDLTHIGTVDLKMGGDPGHRSGRADFRFLGLRADREAVVSSYIGRLPVERAIGLIRFGDLVGARVSCYAHPDANGRGTSFGRARRGVGQ